MVISAALNDFSELDLRLAELLESDRENREKERRMRWNAERDAQRENVRARKKKFASKCRAQHKEWLEWLAKKSARKELERIEVEADVEARRWLDVEAKKNEMDLEWEQVLEGKLRDFSDFLDS
jgi:hypothetical protein